MGQISEKTRVIELPSGKTVTVKKPSAIGFGKIQSLVDDDNWMTGLKTIALLAVDPKITLDEEPKNGEVHIDDFEFEDIFVLAAKTGQFLSEVVGNALPFLGKAEKEIIEQALLPTPEIEKEP